MSGFYISVIVVLCCVALTRHRIWVLCGFYCVYGVLKVIALGEVLEWRDLALFQGLYVVLAGSIMARLWQDDGFWLQINRLPKMYFVAIGMIYVSALYSISYHVFTPGDGNGLAPKLTIAALFFLGALQLQRSQDFKIFLFATVFVSLALSVWVIWSAATLNFEA